MYVLAVGQAEIEHATGQVERISPGGVVGETGMLESGSRVARVVAREDSGFVRVDSHRFTELVARMPEFALEVLRVTASRLAAGHSPAHS